MRSLIASTADSPQGFRKYLVLLLLCSGTCAIIFPTRPFSASFFSSRDACALEIPNVAAIPSCVVPNGRLFWKITSFTSDKDLRKLKDHASRDVGFEFDLRILRRTYDQYLFDSDVRFEIVQVALGHNNPYYIPKLRWSAH